MRGMELLKNVRAIPEARHVMAAMRRMEFRLSNRGARHRHVALVRIRRVNRARSFGNRDHFGQLNTPYTAIILVIC